MDAIFADPDSRAFLHSTSRAIAELQKDLKFESVTAESVKGFLAEAENSKASEKEVTARISLLTREDYRNILFQTHDRSQKRWIHRNYIRK